MLNDFGFQSYETQNNSMMAEKLNWVFPLAKPMKLRGNEEIHFVRDVIDVCIIHVDFMTT